MLYIEYPVAQTLTEAIEWLNEGGELWQELEEESPDCCEIENEVDLIEIVYNQEDISDYNIHMVEGTNINL